MNGSVWAIRFPKTSATLREKNNRAPTWPEWLQAIPVQKEGEPRSSHLAAPEVDEEGDPE
jgi:hypothetical protein